MTAPLKADQVAAERLLKAAVREAIVRLRWLATQSRLEVRGPYWTASVSTTWPPRPVRDFRAEAERILRHQLLDDHPELRPCFPIADEIDLAVRWGA